MSDNTTDNVFVTTGTSAAGAGVATDYVNVGGVTAHYQYVKMVFGNDNTATYVSKTSGQHLPVQLFSGGSALGVQGTALKTYLDASGITMNVSVNALGVDTLPVEGVTTSTVPFMVSGTTAIGGAVAVTGDVAVSGSVTSTVSGGVTVGGFTQATTPVLISGTTAIGGAVGVTGNVAVSGSVTSTVSGGVTVGGFTQATTPLLVSGTTAIGGAVGVTGNVAVSATDLDIRGLTFGVSGFTGSTAGDVDHAIVQGISGAFPVSTLIRGASAGNDLGTVIAASGDALKVALTDATINATVNVGSEVGINSTNTHIQVSGSSAGNSDAFPVIIGGSAGATAIGVTMDEVAVTGTVAISGTPTVTATDLDIRGLSFGTVGATASHDADTDSVVVQGVSGAFPVGTVLHGMTDGAGGGPIALSTVFNGNTPTLQVDVLSSTGITNGTAVQIQGRHDGLTLQPVYIAGVGSTGDVSPTEGLVGVTFDIVDGLPVQGGGTAPSGSSFGSVQSLMYGISGPTIYPFGISGDALKVDVVGAAINATISDTDLTIAGGTVEIGGGTLDSATVVGGTLDSVTITGGTVGITYPDLYEIKGISGAMSLIGAGVTGICGGVQDIKESLDSNATSIGTLANEVGSLGTQVTTIAADIPTNVVASLSSTAPSKRVFVEATPPTAIIRDSQSGSLTQSPFASAALRSGARVKLHPLAEGIVFINGDIDGPDVGYPLAAGDEIFIEIDNLNKITVSSSGGTNMTVFALGF
jgi:fibronectin-binding autotransporter adhesin